MKKALYFSMIAIAAAVFASCEPEIIPGGVPGDNVTAAQIEQGFVIDGQFADAACTEPAADGNFIKFHTSPATTVCISQTAADGTKTILYTGASGVFQLKPKRGQSNDQTFNVEAINPDASIVSFQSTVNVYVPSELDPELKLLLGDGKKAWMWDFVDATCWGNAGNSGAGSGFSAKVVDGKWWGVTNPEELNAPDQLVHAGGTATGAEDSKAYMVFDEEGNITSYKADGTPIVSGTFKIVGYDPSRASGWEIGKLQTSVPAVLFPYSINGGGTAVSEFNIMYLDKNYMTLVDQKNSVGSWAEITYWCFKNKDVITDILNGGSERTWTWDYREAVAEEGADPAPSNEFWGNAGSSGAGANFGPDAVDGKWWGVKSTAEFEGQFSHAPGGAVTPDMNQNAYMVFTADGKITSYSADGTQINSASYEVTDWDGTRASGWQLGYLETSGASVLFPYGINTNGTVVNKFSIMYADADYLTLVDDKADVGGWSEITFWKFKAKK